MYCDRQYKFGVDIGPAFFTTFAGPFTAIHSSANPLDGQRYASLVVPDGYVADIYVFINVNCEDGCSCSTHECHSADDMPNVLDPKAGWVQSDYAMEASTVDRFNPRTRELWTKTVAGTYDLYHQKDLSWGNVVLARTRSGTLNDGVNIVDARATIDNAAYDIMTFNYFTDGIANNNVIDGLHKSVGGKICF